MPDVIPNEPLLNQFIDSVIANSQNAQEVIVTATESVANRVAKSATKKKAKIKKAVNSKALRALKEARDRDLKRSLKNVICTRNAGD